jgi:ferric-dicitrate binding protein FerR (iron transport regulator)
MQSSLKPRVPNRLRRTRWFFSGVMAILLIVSILSVSAVSSGLAASGGRALGGALYARGTVNVNGQRATDGQTLFANSRVSTEKNSESLITFGNGSRLNLSAQSDLTIEYSETRVFLSLETGRVLIDIPEGVALNFETADLAINKQSTGEAILQIESSECGGTRLDVRSGQLEVHHYGRSELINERETLLTMSATVTPQGAKTPSYGKSKLGIFSAIGGAVAIVLAVALGPHDQPADIPLDLGGGVSVNPSPR